MRINEPGSRMSDLIMRRVVADRLMIPETDPEDGEKPDTVVKTAATEKECCSCPDGNCKCGCTASRHASTVNCPTCKVAMQTIDEMDRCAVCAYAQPHTHVTAKQEKSAADTGVMEYYKKIFPDAYAAELTKENPDKALMHGKADYGVKSAFTVSAREIFAENRKRPIRRD